MLLSQYYRILIVRSFPTHRDPESASIRATQSEHVDPSCARHQLPDFALHIFYSGYFGRLGHLLGLCEQRGLTLH